MPEYLSRTPSNLQPSASTYITSNPYSITQQYSPAALTASTLSRSRLVEDTKSKTKKYNLYSSVSPNNMNNQQESDDRLLIIKHQNNGEDSEPNSPDRIYIRRWLFILYVLYLAIPYICEAVSWIEVVMDNHSKMAPKAKKMPEKQA